MNSNMQISLVHCGMTGLILGYEFQHVVIEIDNFMSLNTLLLEMFGIGGHYFQSLACNWHLIRGDLYFKVLITAIRVLELLFLRGHCQITCPILI